PPLPRSTHPYPTRRSSDLLEASGYRAAPASNGQVALDLIDTIGKPCLILLDLMMPVMDGWAFLTALDQDDALVEVPIVIVSAYTDRKSTRLNSSHVKISYA